MLLTGHLAAGPSLLAPAPAWSTTNGAMTTAGCWTSSWQPHIPPLSHTPDATGHPEPTRRHPHTTLGGRPHGTSHPSPLSVGTAVCIRMPASCACLPAPILLHNCSMALAHTVCHHMHDHHHHDTVVTTMQQTPHPGVLTDGLGWVQPAHIADWPVDPAALSLGWRSSRPAPASL